MALPLPQELIVEILSWVPVESLVRFRCVSKTWNSLILHPTFVKLHLQRSPRNTHVLITHEEEEDPNDEEKETDGHERASPCSIRRLFENPSSALDDRYQFDDAYSFVGSCNGLVCLRYSGMGVGLFREFWVRFWNPATRIMSEDSPRIRLHPRHYRVFENEVKFGFGYDDWSDTYKVVALLFNESQNWEVRVHCMGDTCWRNILTCPAFPISRQRLHDGHLVSGTVNWLAFRMLGFDYQWKTVTVNQLVIFSYDLNKETYRYLPMPDGLSEVPDYAPQVGVLKGCMCLSYGHRRTHFVVWLMREFGDEKSWTQLLNVSYEQHLQHFPTHESVFLMPGVVPLCMSENDDVMLLANFLYGEFVLYNRRDNRIERTQVFNGKEPLCSFDYVQSLVFPYRN